jgi:hypothetical protein
MKLEKYYSHIKLYFFKMASLAVRLGRFLRRILSLGLADDRIAPLQALSVVLENGGVCIVHASRFFSRIKIRGMQRYYFEKGNYPTPENVASAVTLAVNEFRAMHAQIILVIPKSWTIVKTADFPLSVMDNLSDVVSYELDRLTPFAAARAFYDFQMISQNDHHLQLMIAAVNRDILEPYIAALKEKKISLSRMTLSTSAFGALADYVQRSGDIVFASVDHGEYEGGLIRDHRWRASFTGKLPAGDEQAQIRFAAEEINALLDGIDLDKGKIDVIIDWRLSEKSVLLLRDSIHAKVNFIGKMDLNLPFLNKGDLPEVPYPAVGGVLEHLRPACF